jgi:tRNA pseudouridine32 synthase
MYVEILIYFLILLDGSCLIVWFKEQAIKEGSVLINGTVKSTLETVIKDGDYISHKLHRHEPPVSDRPVGIVYEDDRLMAINKPAGVPVHPAGRYHFNSVVEILKFERGDDWNPLRMLTPFFEAWII